MKFRHAVIFIPCLIVSLWSAVTPGRAVTHITSADTITVGLGVLPAATYDVMSIGLNFSATDFLDPDEGFRISLFTSGNALVGQLILPPGTFNNSIASLTAQLSTTGVDNTGHFFIDQIVGSFDVHSIAIQGHAVNGSFTDLVTASFTVGQATPLPAALPLFATGLGVLGLIGWRRKRRLPTLFISNEKLTG